MAGDKADLVAEPEPVGGCRDGEPAVLVGGALIGGGGLVADEWRAGIEGERFQPSIDYSAVLGRAPHHCRPHIEARLEGLSRLAVAVAGAVAVAAIVGVHEDVRVAVQFGIDHARRLELEAAGVGPGDGRAVHAADRGFTPFSAMGAELLADARTRKNSATAPVAGGACCHGRLKTR